VSSGQTENEAQAARHGSVANQSAPLKAISIPPAPDPGSRVSGKVTLSIVVDAKGNVSQATALSGLEELVPAALAFAKTWQYEPPVSAPVTTTVEISYGSRECPGPISERSEVEGSGRLFDKNGKLVAVVDDDKYRLPPYPLSERKSGVVGKMILSVTLNSTGHVKEIHAFRSLSPGLDKAAIDMVRSWKFTLRDENPNVSLEDLRLQFVFRATCSL
jgi:TonB family protein